MCSIASVSIAWLTFVLFLCFVFHFFAVQPFSRRAHLVVGVDEGASRHVVGVHGHRPLLGSQVLTLVQWQWDHWALVIQTTFPGKIKKRKRKKQTKHVVKQESLLCKLEKKNSYFNRKLGAYCVDWTVGKNWKICPVIRACWLQRASAAHVMQRTQKKTSACLLWPCNCVVVLRILIFHSDSLWSSFPN